MIGPPRQHDAGPPVILHPLQGAFPLCAHIRLGAQLLRPGRVNGLAGFAGSDAEAVLKEMCQPVCRYLFAGQRQEGLEEPHPVDILHVVGDVFRVGDHHGAVKMILRAGVLLMFIKDAGVENCFYALIDQPLDMPVRQLGGVAFALRGNGLHAQLVDGA